MRRLFIILTGMLCLGSVAFAQSDGEDAAGQDSTWDIGGMGALTFNQVGLFNWAAGGQSNITLIGNFSLFANRTAEESSWENRLDLAYGFIKNDFVFNPDAPITKAEDRIEFNSKYGMQAWDEKVFYTALVNFRTQFDYGRQNPTDPQYISRFFSPAYFVFAVGLDYKPTEALSIFFGPASGKVTIVTDDSLASISAFGVNQLRDPEDPNSEFLPGNSFNTRIELGATFRAHYKKDLNENVGLESQLELFSNYLDRPQNIDIRWNNALVAKLTKYLNVNLFTDLIYDHDIRINLVDARGLPIYSINPEPILNPETGQFETNTTYWPGANYPEAGNPQPDDDTADVVRVQRKGPRIQFKQIFGLGFAYKF